MKKINAKDRVWKLIFHFQTEPKGSRLEIIYDETIEILVIDEEGTG